MKVNKTLIAASFAAGIVIGSHQDIRDVLQRMFRTLDTKLASSLPLSLRNVRWLFPTAALATVAGAAYFLEEKTDPLDRTVEPKKLQDDLNQSLRNKK